MWTLASLFHQKRLINWKWNISQKYVSFDTFLRKFSHKSIGNLYGFLVACFRAWTWRQFCCVNCFSFGDLGCWTRSTKLAAELARASLWTYSFLLHWGMLSHMSSFPFIWLHETCIHVQISVKAAPEILSMGTSRHAGKCSSWHHKRLCGTINCTPGMGRHAPHCKFVIKKCCKKVEQTKDWLSGAVLRLLVRFHGPRSVPLLHKDTRYYWLHPLLPLPRTICRTLKHMCRSHYLWHCKLTLLHGGMCSMKANGWDLVREPVKTDKE